MPNDLYRGTPTGEQLAAFGSTVDFQSDGDLDLSPAAGRTVGIGGAPTKKVSLHGGTGTVQITAIANIDAGTIDGTYGAEEQAVLGDIRTKLNLLLAAWRLRGDLAT